MGDLAVPVITGTARSPTGFAITDTGSLVLDAAFPAIVAVTVTASWVPRSSVFTV